MFPVENSLNIVYILLNSEGIVIKQCSKIYNNSNIRKNIDSTSKIASCARASSCSNACMKTKTLHKTNYPINHTQNTTTIVSSSSSVFIEWERWQRRDYKREEIKPIITMYRLKYVAAINKKCTCMPPSYAAAAI